MEQRTDVGSEMFEDSATSALPPGDHADLSVGEVLRRNRLFYEKTIADVEAILRIRASYLDALERGEFHRLPGRVYAIGFVRSYAEYLGLDPDVMIRKFKAQTGGYAVKPEYSMPVPASESRVAGSWVLISSIACAVLVLSIWLIVSQADRSIVPSGADGAGLVIAPPPSPESVPGESPSVPVQAEVPAAVSPAAGTVQGRAPAAAVPAVVPDEKAAEKAASIEPSVGLAVAPPGEEKPLTIPSAPSSSEDISFTPSGEDVQTRATAKSAAPTGQDSGDLIAPPGGAVHRVLIKAIQSTWIEIRDPDGVVLLSSILKAGDMYFVPDRKGLVLSTGNAGGFEVEVDGKPVRPLGEIGDVRRGVSIDPEALVN